MLKLLRLGLCLAWPLELDAAYSNSSIGSPDQADPSQELTYVDIDTFLSSFGSSLTRVGMGTLRTRCANEAHFAFIALHFMLT